MFYLITFRPFNEKVLNVTNVLCEGALFIIFTFSAITLTNISQSVYDSLDDILVFFVNFIMFTQMIGSVVLFGKNVVVAWYKGKQTKVVPIQGKYANSDAIPTEEAKKYFN